MGDDQVTVQNFFGDVLVQKRLTDMGIPPAFPDNDPTRAVFCNRTINLRAVRAVGFDMDYTLIQYDVGAWEGKAYAYGAPCFFPRASVSRSVLPCSVAHTA